MELEAIFVSLAKDGSIAVLFAMLLWWMTQKQEKFLFALSRQVEISNLLLIGLQKELLAHDLTVSGFMSLEGVDINERAAKTTQKYEEIRKVLEQIEKQVAMIGEQSRISRNR